MQETYTMTAGEQSVCSVAQRLDGSLDPGGNGHLTVLRVRRDIEKLPGESYALTPSGLGLAIVKPGTSSPSTDSVDTVHITYSLLIQPLSRFVLV